MASRAQVPSRWSLIDGARVAAGTGSIVTPTVPRSSLTPLLSCLLPNRDHNEDLMQRLRYLPKGSAAAQPLFAIFAADPFIKAKRIAPRLLGKGYRCVINWPTTAQYGTEFCRALDSVDLGPQQEYRSLRALREQGLSISVAVCDADAAQAAAALDPEYVFLTPSFDLWTNSRQAFARDLVRRCEALARALPAGTRLVLMSPRGGISLAQARKAGASALLLG